MRCVFTSRQDSDKVGRVTNNKKIFSLYCMSSGRTDKVYRMNTLHCDYCWNIQLFHVYCNKNISLTAAL